MLPLASDRNHAKVLKVSTLDLSSGDSKSNCNGDAAAAVGLKGGGGRSKGTFVRCCCCCNRLPGRAIPPVLLLIHPSLPLLLSLLSSSSLTR